MPKKKKIAKRKPAKRKVRKISKKRVLKRKVVRRKTRAKKPQAKKPQVVTKLKGNVIGKVTHYFPKVRAAVVKLKAPLSVGDAVKIKGHTTDFAQTVTSLQIDRVPINSAKKGQEIGLLVDSRVRQNDVVYKP
jgi:sRNA-binding protein